MVGGDDDDTKSARDEGCCCCCCCCCDVCCCYCDCDCCCCCRCWLTASSRQSVGQETGSVGVVSQQKAGNWQLATGSWAAGTVNGSGSGAGSGSGYGWGTGSGCNTEQYVCAPRAGTGQCARIERRVASQEKWPAAQSVSQAQPSPACQLANSNYWPKGGDGEGPRR